MVFCLFLILTFFHPVKLRHTIPGATLQESGQYRWD
jgi:hypothetical protein